MQYTDWDKAYLSLFNRCWLCDETACNKGDISNEEFVARGRATTKSLNGALLDSDLI